MFSRLPANSKILAMIGAIFILLIVILGGFGGFRYFADRNNYTKGHQAYLQADCITAVNHFNKIINTWRLADIGHYSKLAEQEKAECQDFQVGVNFEANGDVSSALVSYLSFMTEKSNSPLAHSARSRITSFFQADRIPALASETSCTQIGTLIENNLIPSTEANLPLFYYACRQVYDKTNQAQFAFTLYQWTLTTYPEHPISTAVEKALSENSVACEQTETLRQSTLANRANFMPSLYYGCGQKYEEDKIYDNAIKMYESFMNYYPDHPLANDVKAAMVRARVKQAMASGSAKIPQPESSGTTTSGTTELTIQNDSPFRLRILFSGQEARIEELESCSTCVTFPVAPSSCPQQGPIGTYTLQPSQYDILVEAISDNSVTPFTNTWDLSDGKQYYECIYSVSK